MRNILYTVGHSTHHLDDFIALLKKHAITALCDVRSQPYSQFTPQFNRESLKQVLKNNGIAYVFLGHELGARTENPACYLDGKVQYHQLAQEALFKQGVTRVLKGMENYSVALMCAEKDPITCHRMVLVCREMRPLLAQIDHILEDGQIETNAAAEQRLMDLLKIAPDMFKTKLQCVEEAYDRQGQKIAYVSDNTQTMIG